MISYLGLKTYAFSYKFENKKQKNKFNYYKNIIITQYLLFTNVCTAK